MSIVHIENLNKTYVLNNSPVKALKNIHLTVDQGEFLAIAGPSGSGKTTLLNVIGCIDQPDSGHVQIGGVEISSLSSDELADLRANKISFIFQNFNLFPVLTALENVEYPLLLQKVPAKERSRRAKEALEEVGLGRFERHKPMELSGGQQQRVAIARAIVRNPLLVLADEPTANLDHKTGEDILRLMKTSSRDKKTTFIFSTHDQKVMDNADRIVKVWDGEIVP